MSVNSFAPQRSLDVVRSCGVCATPSIMEQAVTSWHQVSDGLVGYLRCRCGGWLIVRPGSPDAGSAS